jgi:hypothetical protein
MRRWILFICLSACYAQSQSPSPAPAKAQKDQVKASPKAGKTDSDQNPSNQNVFNGIAVKGGDQQQPAGRSGKESSADWWSIGNTAMITLFTGVLALLAYRQWRTMEGHERGLQALGGYLRDGLVGTKKAAEAAREGAEAANKTAGVMMEAERAWVAIFIPPEKDGSTYRPGPAETLTILYVKPALKNFGKTIAVAKTMKARLQLVPVKEALPPIPIYDSAETQTLTGDITLFPEVPFQPFSLGISNGDMRRVFNREVNLWVYGYVDFIDAFGRPWETKFCMVFHIPGGFNPNPQGFYISGPEEYNRST